MTIAASSMYDLRVKIPFYGKPAGFNKLYDNRQAGNRAVIFDVGKIAPPIYIVYFIFSQWNVAICRKIKLYNSYFVPCTEKRAIL